MFSVAWRRWLVPLFIILAVGVTSCGTYESLGASPSIIEEHVGPDARVRVRFSEGGFREEFVVRVEEDVLVCRRNEFRWEDIETVELWRFDAGKTLGLVGGVVGFAAFCLLAASQSMASSWP